jgi:hypothetical protein
MIETGTLVLWNGHFTRTGAEAMKNWIGIVSGDAPELTPIGLYYRVIFPHTTQMCSVGELEVLS